MSNPKVFDKIAYDKGDVVIRKLKDGIEKARTVLKSEEVGNIDDLIYHIIYFEDDPTTWHVSFEYEPYNEKEKARYYEVWKDCVSHKVKRKAIKKPKGKKQTQTRGNPQVLQFERKPPKEILT